MAVADKLAALFPACFTRHCGDPHRPLKIGIHRDILALRIFAEDEVNAVLILYTRRFMYQRALAAGGVRVDLDGNAAGEVAADQIEMAKRCVAGMEKNCAKKAKAAAGQRGAGKAARKEAANDAAAPAPDPVAPRRLGLAELRAAAVARRAGEARA